MDQLDEISERVKNLKTTSQSRIDTSVELGYVLITDLDHFSLISFQHLIIAACSSHKIACFLRL